MDRLSGKVAVVIGAGQSPGESIGNGRATVVRFLQEGASVLAVDRDLASAEESVGMVAGSDGAAFRADVSDTSSLEAAVEAAVERWGRIDVLHYNVGVSLAGGDQPLDGITDEAFDRVMTINLRGAVMAAKYVEPVMRAQRSGVIINVASMSAIETSTPLVTYRASKAGMVAFTQQLAMRNAEFGVRANAILPGRMETSMAIEERVRRTGVTRDELIASRRALIPLVGHAGTGWDIGNAAVFLASDEAAFITGVSLPVDGGSLVKIGF